METFETARLEYSELRDQDTAKRSANADSAFYLL